MTSLDDLEQKARAATPVAECAHDNPPSWREP